MKTIRIILDITNIIYMDRCSFFSCVSRLLPFVKLGKIRDKLWPVMGSMILVTRAFIPLQASQNLSSPKTWK